MSLKTAVQSIGIGLFLAGAILSINERLDDKPTVSKETAAPALDKGSIIIKQSELDTLHSKISTLEKENSKLNKQTKEQDIEKTYTIDVRSGMGTSEVSKLLKKEGIIKNSDDFEAYIINEGKSSSIQLGKSEVNSSMTNSELLKVLTKRK